MKKNCETKSVRIPVDIIKKIDDLDGRNFTDKVTGVLEEYFNGIAERKQEIEYYDNLIAKRKEELLLYNGLLQTFGDMRRRVVYLERELACWMDQVKCTDDKSVL